MPLRAAARLASKGHPCAWTSEELRPIISGVQAQLLCHGYVGRSWRVAHRMKGAFRIVVALVVSLSTVASADILKWTDEAGVTHYTNLKAEVPSEQAAQVVVDEQVWLPPGPAPAEAKKEDPPVAPPLQPPRDAEDEVVRAYVAGLESGLAGSGGTGGSVYISGPLAVTISPPPFYPTYVQPAYEWLLPGYSPFLTTPVIGRPRGPIHERFATGGHRRFAPFPDSISAAGPPPIGAAGRPPVGAAGRPPVGAAGRPPVGAAGGSLLRVSGSGFLH